MAKIVIRKRVSLSFLGKGYEESYLDFKAIPIKDYQAILEEIENNSDDNKKSLSFIIDLIPKYFLEGKFQGEDVIKEDLNDLDQDTFLEIFQRITGQKVDQNLSQG